MLYSANRGVLNRVLDCIGTAVGMYSMLIGRTLHATCWGKAKANLIAELILHAEIHMLLSACDMRKSKLAGHTIHSLSWWVCVYLLVVVFRSMEATCLTT
jgi:hypothetical protein